MIQQMHLETQPWDWAACMEYYYTVVYEYSLHIHSMLPAQYSVVLMEKPTSRNSSPRSRTLGSIPSSQSCWWALISQYLSPTSPYRPWCLPLQGGAQNNRYIYIKEKHAMIKKMNAKAGPFTCKSMSGNSQSSASASRAQLAGSSVHCCRGWADITDSVMQSQQTVAILNSEQEKAVYLSA